MLHVQQGYRVSSHAISTGHFTMNDQTFERFDLTKESPEAYNVTVQPEPESEISIDTLGGLSDSEDELKAVLQARDALERRLMLIPGTRHWQPLKTGLPALAISSAWGLAKKKRTAGPLAGSR